MIMKLVVIIFILTVISAFISGDYAPSENIDRQIDSINIETKINQGLFRIRINKLSHPKI